MKNWYIVQSHSSFENKVAQLIRDEAEKAKLSEKIEEIGVDEIKKWGEGDLEEVEENLKSHSMIDEDEYPSSSLEDVVREKSYEPDSDIYVNGVSLFTKVNISLPNREELFPEKLVA